MSSSLGDKTLQHQIRPQMLDIVYHEADIFLHIKQMKIFRMLPVLQSHAGTPYQLQLVHLQGSEWQAGQYTGLCHDAFVRPSMTCPPVRIPREAVLSTASAAA